jgi:hypothetical protein
MYITIPTPAYDDGHGTVSYFPAHLLEHCVGVPYPIDEEYFFSSVIDSDQEFFETYTRFYFPNTDDVDTCIELLTWLISPDIYIKELALIQQELEDSADGYEAKILVSLWTALYGDTAPTNAVFPISYTDLTAYHQRYYRKELMCITDDDFAPLFLWKEIQQQQKNCRPSPRSWDDVHMTSFVVDENTYCAILLPYTSWKHYMGIYFMYHLINEYLRWHDRYQHMTQYDYRQIAYVKMSSHWSMVWEEAYMQDIQKLPLSFFKKFQQYYLTSYQESFDAYWMVINTVHGIPNPTEDEIEKFIAGISYEEFMKIIQHSS